MPKFIINASETAFYAYEIEAETEEEAITKAYEADFTKIEPCDYAGFQVDYAEEITE